MFAPFERGGDLTTSCEKFHIRSKSTHNELDKLRSRVVEADEVLLELQ